MGSNEPEAVSLVPADDTDRPSRSRVRSAAVATAAAVGIVALALGVAALRQGDENRDDDDAHVKAFVSPAARAVMSALDASAGSGSYEVDYDFVIQREAQGDYSCDTPWEGEVGEGPAPPGADSEARACSYTPSPITVTGHAVVQLDPYFLEAISNLSNLGDITVRTDGNNLVELGGAQYGTSLGGGGPLSGFASLVESTFGQGPGALTMLMLASPTGYLALSAESVTGATSAGAGTVDGIPVTYYEVAFDISAMRSLSGLSSEQRKAIDEALALLTESEYVEHHARLAIDSAGYVREATSDATFAHGAAMTRHLVFSGFGCATVGRAPVNAPETEPTPDCTASTTSAPTSAPPVPPTSASGEPASTVSAAPATTAAPGTSTAATSPTTAPPEPTTAPTTAAPTTAASDTTAASAASTTTEAATSTTGGD